MVGQCADRLPGPERNSSTLGGGILWGNLLFRRRRLNWILQDDIREISWNCAEALDQNNVWISGGGYIYHYNGSQWIFETDEITTLGEISAVDNTHVYGIPSTTTNKKVYCTFAYPSPTPDGFKTPTPKPIPSATPTPYGFETPSPTPGSDPGADFWQGL